VRFGAYHIYLPALLKPAPRALATQLWAIKHESPEAKGVGDLLHLAASGRTSIPVDKDTPKALYRTAGYRICGERAVRVDILERLADLIRPALSWRETSPGPKPDGVFDGRGFLVTGAMTSLTGASGDDFASILRSLGYRMDRKPKPVQPVAAAPAAEPAAVSDGAPATAEATADAGSSSEKPEPVAGLQSRSLLPEPELVTPETAPETVPGADASGPAAEPAAEAAAANDTAPVPTAENKPAEEPAFVEVWRPAGRPERRPHRPRRQRPQQPQAVAADAAAAPAPTSDEGATSAPSGSTQPSRGPRRPRHDRGERPDREKRQERHERQQRMERQGERADRQGHAARRERPRRERGERVERAEREQYYAKPFGSGSGGRDKQPDPNSPFAKLAALKQQLEQTNKEPS
jgi:ATP-dependent RNA helicase SUPV3L1/SUV3